MQAAYPSNLDVSSSGAPSWLAQIRLELAEGVRLEHDDARWRLIRDKFSLSFRLPPGSTYTVFSKLREEGCSLSELAQVVDEESGPLSVREQVQRLWRQGLLVQVLRRGRNKCAVLHNFGELPLFPNKVQLCDHFIMSEDACIRRQGDSLLIESLEVGAFVQIIDPKLFQIPTAFVNAITCDELARQARVPSEVATALTAWFTTIASLRLVSNLPCGRQKLTGWSFADRFVHARSRKGRHVGGYGGTFALRGIVSEPPALKPSSDKQKLKLWTPNLADISRRDDSLTSVLERRRSIREHDGTPLGFEELSEFLYRTARVKQRIRSGEYEAAIRPYPSGGALYELDFYPLVNRCEGLAPALYRYDGGTHGLEHVTDPTAETRQLLADARSSCGMRGEPHVLILLAARFLRVNWKYESMAYALILKNVGVAYQTMYLVATAMALAPCALGGGNAELFRRAAHTEYWEESSVGEFMLGRSREPSQN
jgi:oxazoline/thiazoline dehydrogenase